MSRSFFVDSLLDLSTSNHSTANCRAKDMQLMSGAQLASCEQIVTKDALQKLLNVSVTNDINFRNGNSALSDAIDYRHLLNASLSRSSLEVSRFDKSEY